MTTTSTTATKSNNKRSSLDRRHRRDCNIAISDESQSDRSYINSNLCGVNQITITLLELTFYDYSIDR